MTNDYKHFLRGIIPVLLKNGWVEIPSTKHIKYKHLKTGKCVTFGSTPSDMNAQRMSFRHIRGIDPVTAKELQELGFY